MHSYSGAAPLPPRSWLALAALGAVFVAVKLPVLNLPFYWDEQAYVLPSAWLAREGLVHVLPGLHPPAQFFGHPPLLYLLLGAQFAAFGETRWIPHLLVLGFALCAIAGTFAIGRRVRDTYTGAVAAALLCATPIFFAQSAMVLADVVLAALGVWAVHCCLAQRRAAYLVTATALLLCKETGLAIVASCAAYAFAVATGPTRAARWRAGLLHAAPALALALFFAAQQWTAHAFVTNRYFATNSLFNAGLFAGETRHLIARVASWLFFSQGKWALALCLAAALCWRPRDLLRRELALFTGIAAAFGAAFVLIFFLPRYLIPVLPFYCIAAACAIASLARGRPWLRLAAPLAVEICLLARLATPCDGGGLETNLCYADAVIADRAAAEWLALQPADRAGVVPWPYVRNLREPVLGYVAQPAPAPVRWVGTPGPAPDFVVTAPSSTTEDEHARLAALLAQGGFAPQARFTSGASVVEVHARAAAQ
jgi:hypothetical protein